MYFVYILCDRPSGNVYTGFTNNIARRLKEHKAGIRSNYAHKLKLFRLVHLEVLGDYKAAIAREKEIKKLSRKERLKLIETNNPDWKEYDVNRQFQSRESSHKALQPQIYWPKIQAAFSSAKEKICAT